MYSKVQNVVLTNDNNHLINISFDLNMDFTKKVKTILLHIGLTEVQAEFYLFLLKTGGSTVSHVAKSLNINRTNSYTIIERLKALDLIFEENKVTGKVIHAKSFEPIISAIEEKERAMSDLKQTVAALAPIFNSFTALDTTSGPKIRTYESKKEFGYLIDDILRNTRGDKEILLYTNQATERGFFSKKLHDDFIKQRVENKIRIKVLAVDNAEGQEIVGKDELLLRETRLLPPAFNFNAEIYIYDNRVTMIDVKEEVIGVIIESTELFSIHEQSFLMLWNSCVEL